MATTRFGPSPVTLPVGTTTIGGAAGVAIPDATTSIAFRVARWSQATRILALRFFQSTDGGTTWADSGSMNPQPGDPSPPIGRDGTTDTVATFNTGTGVGRRVKIEATVTGGSISTTVTIQTEP